MCAYHFKIFQFFKWADEYQSSKSASEGTDRRSSNKIILSSADSLMSFFRSHVSQPNSSTKRKRPILSLSLE